MAATDASSEKLPPRKAKRGIVARIFTYEEESGRIGVRRLRWRRAIGIPSLAIPVLYTLAGAVGFGALRHFGYREVTIAQVLLPRRWHELRQIQGNHLILDAFNALRSEDATRGSLLLRSGLKMNPTHRAGRLRLAQLELSVRQPDAAEQTLLAGLPYHRADPVYLWPVFAFLLQYQKDADVIRLAREILEATSGAPPECRRVAALAAATAAHFRGNYDASDTFISSVPPLATSRDGRLLRAKNDWDRGYRALALVQLRRLAEEHPRDAEVHAEFLQRLRDAGATDEARRTSIAFQIARPELPRARIDLLYSYRDSGDNARVAREAEAVRREFSAHAAALLALADFAADTGNVVLATQLLADARAQKIDWEPHALLRIEALLAAGQYDAVLAGVRELEQAEPDCAKRNRATLDRLQAVAHHALGDVDNARAAIRTFLAADPGRAEGLVALAQRFSALDGTEHAHHVLAHAVAMDPRNQAALTALVSLNLNLNRIDELPAQLMAFVKMRKPSPDVLRVARHKLGSDLFLFSPDRDAALAAVQAALEPSRFAANAH